MKQRVILWAVLLLKSSKLLVLVKSVKLLSIFVTALSLLISTFVYGISLGMSFGIGFVLMLLVHEIGHIAAARSIGKQVSLPLFIPFFGAVIFQPYIENRSEEAYIAIGGPVIGSTAALLCFGLWAITDYPVLLPISYLGIYLNLFNMIPVSPFDGGRITQAVGPAFKYFGIILAAVLIAISQQPGMILILVIMLDGFRFNPGVKPKISVMLCVIMATLMTLGFGTEKFLDILDFIAASGMSALYFHLDHLRKKRGYLLITDAEDRPMPARNIRTFWFCCYVILAAVLIITITIQSHLLAAVMPV